MLAIYVLLATASVAQSRRWFVREIGCWIIQEKVPALWEDARQRCERDGAVLASPINSKMFKFMKSLLSLDSQDTAYFIGTRANHSRTELDTSTDQSAIATSVVYYWRRRAARTRSSSKITTPILPPLPTPDSRRAAANSTSIFYYYYALYSQEVEYVSVEGWRLDEMPRAVYDEIDQLDVKQGDCLSMDRHGIRAVSCWDPLPFICYECDSAPSTDPTTPAPAVVPPGYICFSSMGSCYKLYLNRPSPWDDAYSVCAAEGAHLLVVNDEQEAAHVSRYILNVSGSPDHYLWIGLRDKRPKEVMSWTTILGKPLSHVFHEWGDGRPLNDKLVTCAAFNIDNMRLYDYPCSDLHSFACEMYKWS